MKQTSIPDRNEVKPSDCWDLSTLYADDREWEKDLEAFSALKEKIPGLKKVFCSENITDKKDGLEIFRECLEFYSLSGRKLEKLYVYAHLKQSADESNPENIKRTGRVLMAYSAFEADFSWFIPEFQKIPEDKIRSMVSQIPDGEKLYGVWSEKLIREKPHILSDKEEKILALMQESFRTPQNTFSILTNVDMNFGTVETAEGAVPLTQTTWSKLMENPSRETRKTAYKQFYAHFSSLQMTIASLYAGSVNQDVANARIRGYTSARAAALFPDKVDESVYDNLIKVINSNLEPLHRYYALRKKVLKLDELRHYDVYVPLVKEIKRHTTYEQAVELIKNALAPLGEEYTETLSNGLLGGWVDRYENRGKRSGAFSSGAYTGYPYILLNYKEDVLRDVFTLAHEGGHSMHSWYSAKNNPFLSYEYTIFEAEVASTFNEDMLFRYLSKESGNPEMKAFLLSHRAADIVATLYRQTMFAEYEHKAHTLVEGGTPLTAELLRSEYRKLLEKYFGPEMVFEEESDLEGLRIPHFYNAYYVYKYATGISASMALAERVCSGGEKEREDYFRFLKSGGSRYPVEALRIAGIDMSRPEPVEAACKTFASVIDELEKALEGTGTPA